MRLSKVNKGNLTYHCALCKQEIKGDVYADLDGPSFEAYYDKECGYNFYVIQAVEEPEKRNMDLLRKVIEEMHPDWNNWQAAKADLTSKLEIVTLHGDDGDLSVYVFDDEAHFWREVDEALADWRKEWGLKRSDYSEVLHEMLYGHQTLKQTLWG